MRWRQGRRSASVSFLLSAWLALVVVAWFRGPGLGCSLRRGVSSSRRWVVLAPMARLFLVSSGMGRKLLSASSFPCFVGGLSL
jgi:hypothetical protein